MWESKRSRFKKPDQDYYSIANKLKSENISTKFIYSNTAEGVLINKNYPFGLIKYRSDDFSPEIELNSENAILKIKQPDWIK
mgnify:CR=1 FL=1